MTTLEAAEAFGRLTERQALAFLAEHDADPTEAQRELRSDWLDAVRLCVWLGY